MTDDRPQIDALAPLAPLGPDGPPAPPPDPEVEPTGFMVEADDATRLHFLDWGEPKTGAGRSANDPGPRTCAATSRAPGVLLVHGVTQTAWVWAPVARRLAGDVHVVAPDLRGHGLSDAPPGGYDIATLAGDALAVTEGAYLIASARRPGAEGAGIAGSAECGAGGAGSGIEGDTLPAGADPGAVTDPRGGRLIVAGHGFGAAVATAVAARLGSACAGLVLVDGGWDDADRRAGTTLDEWLRSVEEPPEVLRTMAAFLADREQWDPASWDADQERTARASVVELPSGRVVSSTRRHAIAGVGEALLAWDPVAALPGVVAPIVALAARDDERGAATAALVRAAMAVVAAGRRPPRYRCFPADGHNLMRYRPDEITTAILSLADPAGRPLPR